MPGKTKSYLASLIHLGNYLLTIKGFPEVSRSQIQSMISCLKRWIAAFRKDCNEKGLEKMDSDLRNLVSVEDVK